MLALTGNVFALTDSEITTILGRQCVQPLGVCIALRKDEGFHFNGHVKAVILGGTISIMGVELTPSSTTHKIFAPRSHPTPSFTCIAPAESYHSLSPRLKALVGGCGALALFPSCSGVESLERISPQYRGLFGDQEHYNLGIPGLQVSMPPSKVNHPSDPSARLTKDQSKTQRYTLRVGKRAWSFR
jgi:hypothetical protein